MSELHVPISGLYAALQAFIAIGLVVPVGQLRGKTNVSLGCRRGPGARDGDPPPRELDRARSVRAAADRAARAERRLARACCTASALTLLAARIAASARAQGRHHARAAARHRRHRDAGGDAGRRDRAAA